MSRSTSTSTDTAEQFLRSINICYDANEPARISHYRPTTKCVALVKAILGHDEDRAFFVVAPYGSGKSLTATYLLHLIENRGESSKTLLRIRKKLQSVSPELGDIAERRRTHEKKIQGIVIALHGACPSLAESIKQAVLQSTARLKLGRQTRFVESMPADDIGQAIQILAEIQRRLTTSDCDRIAIIWDEFGRHAEAIVAEGRGAALSEIQLLAEFVNRSRSMPVTLSLIMHQGLLQYASNMPQSVRAEWLKIEGRFRTIQYVDDSKEIYRLVAEVAASRRRAAGIPKESLSRAVKGCRKLDLFRDFSDPELKELLTQAYPIEPATLYLLPRVSARVAQNERTLFSFLYDVDLSQPVTPAALYDYFATAMRSDTAIGGTHRQWLETESAISKAADDEDAIQALKMASLLGLGTSGERSRTGHELLLFAISGYRANKTAEHTVARLIERKLLLHRRHNDEVSVWHGTDLDLRSRLEEAKRHNPEGFDLLAFLSKEVKPSAWKTVEYNDDFCIRRYLTGEYQSVRHFDSYVNFDLILDNFPVDSDGKIVYLIAETTEQLREAEAIAREKMSHDRLVVAIPREPLPLHDAALEVACLSRMQLDSALVESDPLALAEIQQMTDDARDHLQRLVDRLIGPSPAGPRWFYKGDEIKAPNPRDLRKSLSDIMRRVFAMTPVINNEMIVRKKPSSVVINARKKLVLGILERSGQEELGLKGNFPDKSLFRSVLLHTGIYRQDGHGRWGYSAPRSIAGQGLQEVWRKIQEFLTVPSDLPKQPAIFFTELAAPPYGVRAGLIPILIAAGLKAFPGAISLTRDGQYVTDILPSEIEQLCRQPELYRLMVLDVDEKKLNYLRELHKRFSQVANYEVAETDLIRMCFDAIASWKARLPPSAMTVRRISEPTARFRAAISQNMDPMRLLFEQIPAACGGTLDNPKKLLSQLSASIAELAGVTQIHVEQAAQCVRRAVALGQLSGRENIREVAHRWAACFSDSFVESLTDGISKGLLSRMRMPYESDELLLDSLASLLVGKSLTRWEDVTVAVFDREIQNVIHRIEDAGLSSDAAAVQGHAAVHGLTQLVRGRIVELVDRLANLVGMDHAQEVLESVTASHAKRN
jgi:hypothetical protein